MRRSIVLFIALSLILSACGTLEISFETPPPAITDLPAGYAQEADGTLEPVSRLSLSSTSEEIRRLMLESATNWQSIWMDGTFVGFDPGATEPGPVLREQVWIDLPSSRFRSLTGYVDGAMDRLKISDGLSVLEMDLQTGQSQSNPLPDLGPEKQFVPEYQPGYAYPQPLWGQLGTTVSLLAFPSDFAQSEGTFQPLAMEFVADRETLVVEWTYAMNELPSWKMWLDTETGVALKMQHFGKEGSASLQSEIVVNTVVYNGAFDGALFQAPSSPPQFSDMDGNPLTLGQPASTPSSDPDPLGEVYFFLTDHVYGNEKIQFMRVPGSCAASLSPCPEAEVMPTPAALNFSLASLVWSPDREAAAFAYPISPDGNRSALFLFDPESETWQSLAEFNFIDPPYWSPDGNWLAFRVQDGAGSDEIYAVRRDGSGLTNLSASVHLPLEAAPYALSGWISNQVILQSKNNGAIYLVRAGDGSVTTLFETPLAKSSLVVPSPDGYFLAYTEVTGERVALNLLTPDGNTVRELAAFRNTSIYPMVWSPDGSRLAFAAFADARDPAAGQDVMIIGSDGRELHEVHHSSMASISGISFSPDGKYILLQDDDAAGRHIFVVDLSTLEQHKLQVPNLPLDNWWLAPSWR